jgi:hypothetical protein
LAPSAGKFVVSTFVTFAAQDDLERVALLKAFLLGIKQGQRCYAERKSAMKFFRTVAEMRFCSRLQRCSVGGSCRCGRRVGQRKDGAMQGQARIAIFKTPKINHVACPWLSAHLNSPLNGSGLNHLNDDHEMLRHRIAVYDELYAWRAPLLGETHT